MYFVVVQVWERRGWGVWRGWERMKGRSVEGIGRGCEGECGGVGIR